MSNRDSANPPGFNDAVPLAICYIDSSTSSHDEYLTLLQSKVSAPDKNFRDETVDGAPFLAGDAISKGHRYSPPVRSDRASAQGLLQQHLEKSSTLENLKRYSSTLLGRQNDAVIDEPFAPFRPPPRVTLSESRRDRWLQGLSDPMVPLSSLIKTIPHGLWGEDILRMLVKFRVPFTRAIWFIRCAGVNEARSFLRKVQTTDITEWVKNWTDVAAGFLISFISSFLNADIYSFADDYTYLLKLFGRLLAEELVSPKHFLLRIVSFSGDSSLKSFSLHFFALQFFSTSLIQYTHICRKCVITILQSYQQLIVDQPANLLKFSLLSKKVSHFLFTLAQKNIESFFFPTEWDKLKPTIILLWKDFPNYSTLLSIMQERNSKAMYMYKPVTSSIRFLQIISCLSFPVGWRTLAKDLFKLLPVYTGVPLLLHWCINCRSIFSGDRNFIVSSIFDNANFDRNLIVDLTLSFVLKLHPLEYNECVAAAQLLDHLAACGYFFFSKYIARLASLGYLRESMLNSSFMDDQRKILVQLPILRMSQQLKNKIYYILSKGNYFVDWSICDEYVKRFKEDHFSFMFKKEENYAIITLSLVKIASTPMSKLYEDYLVMLFAFHYSMFQVMTKLIADNLVHFSFQSCALIFLYKISSYFVLDAKLFSSLCSVVPKTESQKLLLNEMGKLFQVELNFSYDSPDVNLLIEQFYEITSYESNYDDAFVEYKDATVANRKDFIEFLFHNITVSSKHTAVIFTSDLLMVLKIALNHPPYFDDLATTTFSSLLKRDECTILSFFKILQFYGCKLLSVDQIWAVVSDVYEAQDNNTTLKQFFNYLLDESTWPEGYLEERHWRSILCKEARKHDSGLKLFKLGIKLCTRNEQIMKTIWSFIHVHDCNVISEVIPDQRFLRTLTEHFMIDLRQLDIVTCLKKALVTLDEFSAPLYATWLTTLDDDELSELTDDVVQKKVLESLDNYKSGIWKLVLSGLPNCKTVFEHLLLFSLEERLDLPAAFLQDLIGASAYVMEQVPDSWFLEKLPCPLTQSLQSFSHLSNHIEVLDSTRQSRLTFLCHLILHMHGFVELTDQLATLESLTIRKCIYRNQELLDLLLFSIHLVKPNVETNDEVCNTLKAWENIESRPYTIDFPEALQQYSPRIVLYEPTFW